MSKFLSNPAVPRPRPEEPGGDVHAGRNVFAGLSLVTGVGAAVASSCCALPLALATAGMGGAWLGNFSELVFYRGYVLAAAVSVLVVGWIVAFRRRARACEFDGPCTRPSRGRATFGALGLSTALVGFAAASDWLEPLIVRHLISLGGSA